MLILNILNSTFSKKILFFTRQQKNEYRQIEEKLNRRVIWNEYEEKYSALESYLNSKISVAV